MRAKSRSSLHLIVQYINGFFPDFKNKVYFSVLSYLVYLESVHNAFL
jgi:hypothetical protein